MSVDVKIVKNSDHESWDEYVRMHPMASVFHLAGWGKVIQQTYGHDIYNLMAFRPNQSSDSKMPGPLQGQRSSILTSQESLVGVLPLVHINHFVFGNSLFSQPYADLGGILADDEVAKQALLTKAIEIATEQDIPKIELRQTDRLAPSLLKQGSNYTFNDSAPARSSKVRMLLGLPESSGSLMSSFKSKLRSQIRRPLKDGLKVKNGGVELLNDFYKVFAENMRDLGSPVHSIKFFKQLLERREMAAKIHAVYKGDIPLACSMTLGLGATMYNPWSSSLKRFSRMSPNMLLYWTMFEYACDQGSTSFDFGRSTPDEGTYKFKKQWGAEERSLFWQTCSIESEREVPESMDKSKYEIAMRVWKRLPVSVSRAIGPSIRKNIGL